MRLLFSAPDAALAESVRKTLAGEGVACEVRHVPVNSKLATWPFYAEVWAQTDFWVRNASGVMRTTACARGYPPESPAFRPA